GELSGRTQHRAPGSGGGLRGLARHGGSGDAAARQMSDAAVGIVVVSHSRALALAVIALAREMLHEPTVRIQEAAGLDDGAFGTDAVRVAYAIERADAGRGVVVLMDLGSAVLSAEVAVDLLQPET